MSCCIQCASVKQKCEFCILTKTSKTLQTVGTLLFHMVTFSRGCYNGWMSINKGTTTIVLNCIMAIIIALCATLTQLYLFVQPTAPNRIELLEPQNVSMLMVDMAEL